MPIICKRHLVDAGYATAREVVAARRNHKVSLVGPILASTSWQTKDGGGFSHADFAIDWENQQVTCPNGATSSRWTEDRSQEGTAVVRARFPTAACRPCKAREQCTRSNRHGPRKTPRSGRNSMRTGPVSKARSPKAFEPSACGDAAITGSPRPDCNTNSRPRDELPPPQRLVDRRPTGPDARF
ncbi:hypothetical protein GCM10010272_54640 [Streptomyces lateritius]|nr:hypothetical protein GCM10010272_54640 [Streptomyces lateritius]